MTSAIAWSQLPRTVWQACMQYIMWIFSGTVTVLHNSVLQKHPAHPPLRSRLFKISQATGTGKVSRISISSSLLSDYVACLLYCVRETKLLGLLLELLKALQVFTFPFPFTLCMKYFKKKKVPWWWSPFLHLCFEEFSEDHQNTTT